MVAFRTYQCPESGFSIDPWVQRMAANYSGPSQLADDRVVVAAVTEPVRERVTRVKFVPSIPVGASPVIAEAMKIAYRITGSPRRSYRGLNARAHFAALKALDNHGSAKMLRTPFKFDCEK